METAEVIARTRDFDLSAWREPLPDSFRYHLVQFIPVYVNGFGGEGDAGGWILTNRREINDFWTLNPNLPPAALLQ